MLICVIFLSAIRKDIKITSRSKALAMASAASDKKGIDIITINMRKVSGICDYFVITSGTSTTQVRAISDHMIRQLEAKGQRLRHVEGEREASWILIDFGDVVGHVFLKSTREFYDLEELWSDAPQIPFEEPKSRRIPARKAVKKLIKKSAGKSTKKIKKTARKKSKQ